MSSLKEIDSELFSVVRKVLLEDWDPIEVADVEEAQDEYDSYIPHICSLLIQNSGIDALTDLLFHTEINTMGMFSEKNHCRDVALKLQAAYTSLI